MGLFSQSHGILCVLNIEESFTSLPSLIIIAIINTITSSEMLGLWVRARKGPDKSIDISNMINARIGKK